ncbi:MAG: glycosyltransferase family 4 protein [Acidimicrobiia bacterium]|nr:glycosyltransferase family 4 protein [Acidimicrobiia bacterium]
MRLAVVTNDYPPKPGGIQQYLGNLVDAWPDAVRVLAPNDGPADETDRGETVVRRGSARFMWPTPLIRGWVMAELRAFEPDAVLFGAPYPLSRLAPTVSAGLDVPVGVLGHGAEVVIPAALPGVRSLLRSTLRAADVRFAVSHFTQQRLRRLTSLPVEYVGAGVDIDRFTPDADTTTGSPPVLGCVSRFVPRKGQDRVLRAAALLAERGTAVKVLIVGKGRKEQSLRRLADRLGVDAHFAVDVPWGDLPSLYRSMDIFCMPCRTRWGGLEVEGLGLVFLEAAAVGIPVLAGASGGSPETVDPGRTGYVVNSIGAIADAVERIVTDSDRGRMMGRAGRTRVEEQFTWNAVVTRFEAGFAAARNV